MSTHTANQASQNIPSEHVLIVKDDDGLRQLLLDELEDRDLVTQAVSSAEEAAVLLD